MLNAIGSSTYTNPAGTGTPTAGLESQLARYQKELSNCVNCDTANTRAGRETIQTLSNRISQIKARIEAIDAAKPSTQPTAPNAITPAETIAKQNASGSATQGNSVVGATAEAGYTTATTGGRLDVFA